MGTTDYGTQRLSFDYNQDATAKLFNNINYQLLPVGLYTGFNLSKISNSQVLISTGVCFIQDSVNNVGTRIETTTTQSLSVANANPYIVFRFEWADAQNNYMDMLSVPYSNIRTNDLIVGRCVFDDAGTTLNEVFDYTRRSNFYTQKQQIENTYLRVYPTEPATNQFTITAGVLNSSKGNLNIIGGTYPVGGLVNTVNGRHDIVYIDENGVVRVELGVDSSSPVAPRYGNRKVVAEIRRGAGRTSIKGNEIVRVLSSLDMNATSSDTLLTDAGSFYTSTNVEDAFQEIAGSDFTFSGIKTFNRQVRINAATGYDALIVRGVTGYQIQRWQRPDGTSVQYIDQNGLLTNLVGMDIPIPDIYGCFSTAKYSEAINQIAGGTFTFKGPKTFTGDVTFNGNVYFNGTMRIPNIAPSTPVNGNIWYT